MQRAFRGMPIAVYAFESARSNGAERARDAAAAERRAARVHLENNE